MDAEQLAHLAYGEIVKRFHLGTAHVFQSWDRLSEDERARWLAVFREVYDNLQKDAAEGRLTEASRRAESSLPH